MLRQGIILAALLMTGCGRSPDFACDRFVHTIAISGHQCTEINDLEPARIDAKATSCRSRGGVVIDSCPGHDDLGVCTSIEDGLTLEIHFYSDFGAKEARAKAACDQMAGTWTSS